MQRHASTGRFSAYDTVGQDDRTQPYDTCLPRGARVPHATPRRASA
ncbi:hypothetical protein [Streptomyces sp. JV178]|nr:hypothetical protein [Streptomyces sp. JV178]